MASKKPKFFCDFCGNEVSKNDIACKHCGKFFAAVRCPNCGKTGNAGIFSNGCPSCGYAFSAENSQPSTKNNKSYSFFAPKKASYASDPLPIWLYFAIFASGIALVAILLVLTWKYLQCTNVRAHFCEKSACKNFKTCVKM